MEKTPSMKLVGVMLDVNVSWRYHIKTVENNLSKNIDETSLKTTYFSYIHSFLNCAITAWASTHFTKLKTINYKK